MNQRPDEIPETSPAPLRGVGLIVRLAAIGAAMVASLGDYHRLVAIHRPLGIMILILAYLLFLTFLAHLSAVLFHTLIIRDRLLDRMALWPTHSRKNKR
jgi:cytochrome b561